MKRQLDLYFVFFSVLMDCPANLREREREREREGEQVPGEIKDARKHMLWKTADGDSLLSIILHVIF